MDHQAAQELFSDYLEGELSPQERQELSSHLAECELCRVELEDLKTTMRSLSGLMTLPPPEGFVSKVQQKIRKRSRGRFFTPERLLMRVPFEWISFIIIMLMLALYMFMVLGQGAVVKPGGAPKVEQGATSQPIPPPPAPEVASKEVLGTGGVLVVTVEGEEELSGKFIISAEGTITFPLAGTLKVAGKTPVEVAAMLRERLVNGGALKNPRVSISAE